MRISDWSSVVCSSDLARLVQHRVHRDGGGLAGVAGHAAGDVLGVGGALHVRQIDVAVLDRRVQREGAAKARHVVGEIGRASCRERVCQSVYISVFVVSLKKNIISLKIYNKTTS